MNVDPVLLGLGREALVLALWVSLPPLGAALLVGLVVGALQAATQIQDPGVAVDGWKVLARTLALSYAG